MVIKNIFEKNYDRIRFFYDKIVNYMINENVLYIVVEEFFIIF